MGLLELWGELARAAVSLLCAVCWRPLTFVTVVPATCEHCGGSKLVSVANLGDTPKKRYALSENDRRLLRSFKIQPEV